MSRGMDSTKNLKKRILAEMRTGMFADCDKLPREIVLAEELGISRTQLRDALPELEREGFITRRHGVGTVINRHVLDVKNRMDIETEFMEIIRNNGYEPSILQLDIKEDQANAREAQKLSIQEGEPIIRICLLSGADGKPAIYSEDVFAKVLVKEEYRGQENKCIVFDFLAKFCDVEVYMDLTKLHAVVADERLAKLLDVAVGTPLFNMEEVDYDIEGRPVFYSRQYFVDGIIEHTVLRMNF